MQGLPLPLRREGSVTAALRLPPPASGPALAEFSLRLRNRLEMAREGAGLLGSVSLATCKTDPQVPRLPDWGTPFLKKNRTAVVAMWCLFCYGSYLSE